MVERKEREPMFGQLEDIEELGSVAGRLRSGQRSDEPDPGVVTLNAGHRGQPPRPDSGAERDALAPISTGLATNATPSRMPEDVAAGNPGAGMRAAREQRGWDVATLAMRTRLSRRIIEALESNRFDAMPPAYVRGYLRAVARELNADGDSWVAAYEDLGFAEPVVRPTVQRNPSGHWGLNGTWYALVGVLLVSAFGLGIYVWTEGDRNNPFAGLVAWVAEKPFRLGSDPAEVTETDAADAADVLDVHEEGPMASANVPAAEDAMGLVWATTPRAPLVQPDEPPLMELSPEPLPEEIEASAQPPVSPEAAEQPEPRLPETASAPAAAAVAEPVSPVVAGAGEAVLQLSFEDTSWVEIRSASDRVDLRGIFHAGDVQQVLVTLPARVVLGNARGVRLARDGSAVDFSRHVREDRTARFSLGADG